MSIGRLMGNRRSRRVGFPTVAGLLMLTVLQLNAASSALGPTDPVGTAPGLERGRPNVILIMVDDMRDDDLRFMPWTRALVRKEGARFANSFSPFPLCCPARASVLTGLYSHNHDVYGVFPPYGFSSFDDRSTIATWLQDAGYWTVFLGKYLNGYGAEPPYGVARGRSLHYVPPGWTKWRASIDGGLPPTHPKAGGTYFYRDTTLSLDGRLTGFPGRFQTGVLGKLAQQIVRRRTAPEEPPFFFYLSFTAPHFGLPVEPDDPTARPRDGSGPWFKTPARPPWTWGMYDDLVRRAPGARWVDPDISDKPLYIRNDPPLSAEERDALLELTRQRAEALAAVDLKVKRIIELLAESGELDDTYVIFTSDNGFFLGEQRRRQRKTAPYDPALKVPLLIRGPGIPANSLRTDPIMSIDVAPTIADMVGVSPPRPVDGVSLLDTARFGDTGWRRAVLTSTGPMLGRTRETDEAGGRLGPGEQRDARYIIGVRTQRYLYTDLASGMKELYDLEVDPRQYDNVVEDPDYAPVRKALRRVLEQMRACRGAECRAPLPPLLGPR